MKKSFVVLLCVIFLLSILPGCGSNKNIDGKEIKTFGILGRVLDDPSMFDTKVPGIKYKIIWGNVIWGCLLVETIIAPIYFFGFSLFEPVESIDKEIPKTLNKETTDQKIKSVGV